MLSRLFSRLGHTFLSILLCFAGLLGDLRITLRASIRGLGVLLADVLRVALEIVEFFLVSVVFVFRLGFFHFGLCLLRAFILRFDLVLRYFLGSFCFGNAYVLGIAF